VITKGYIPGDRNLQVTTRYKNYSTLLNIPHTNIQTTVFQNAMPCSPVVSNVSEEHTASVFKVEHKLSMVRAAVI
jgi:hypothetical protein